MKKRYFLGAALALVLGACSNNTKGTHTGESGPNMTNVENVNGNIPDTSSGAVLNKAPSQDSSHAIRDSAH